MSMIMINRRSLLGSLAVIFSGFGIAVAQTVSYSRKVYLTVRSNKKDEQYGLENGLIEIYDQDNGKIRRIRISDGVITSSDNIVYKKQIGGLLPKDEEYIPMSFPGKMPNKCVQGDYVVIPTYSNLTMEDICKLRGVEYLSSVNHYIAAKVF